MKTKIIYTWILAFIVGGIEISCSESISDCPSKTCILASEDGWQLIEVYEDGVKQNIDVSNYKIILTLPDPDATEGTFERARTDGRQDQGRWGTLNKDEVLFLRPETFPEEQYIIDSFSPHELVLVINRDSNKVGPKQLKYVFQPI